MWLLSEYGQMRDHVSRSVDRSTRVIDFGIAELLLFILGQGSPERFGAMEYFLSQQTVLAVIMWREI